MVAGTAGAVAAALVQHGEIWKSSSSSRRFTTCPRYELFAGRLDDEKRHSAEIRRLHEQTMGA